MAVTPSSFRAQFPEFGDLVAYPDSLLNSWLSFAIQFVNEARWGEATDLGVSLFLAHSLAEAGSAARSAAMGASPGGGGGILSSKSGGGLSASYDVSSITEQGAGFWNGTSYGRRFWHFLNLMGAGPVQVGTDGGVVSPTGAWPGFIY